MPQEIVIDPSKVKPGSQEAKYLSDLIFEMDQRYYKSYNNQARTFKLTKSRGFSEKTGTERDKEGYLLFEEGKTVHLANFSLIRFPNSDRYYVIGRELGAGAMGKVKVLPIYFTRSPDGTLSRHEDQNREEIIKIIKSSHRSTGKQEAEKEATLAREAGGQDAVFGAKKDEKTGYVKFEKAKGTDLEKYLQDHPDITLEERTKMIRQIMEELQKIRERGYFYVDIKPENIFYDGKKITFIDWGSAGKAENMWETPGTPMFMSGSYSNASQREAYAVAGLIGIILSDFNSPENPGKLYDHTPVIKPKYDALPERIEKMEDCKKTLAKDYDFSQITPAAFNLEKNSEEAKALNELVGNLKHMGSQNVKKRDQISHDDYKVFMGSLHKLESTLEGKFEFQWLGNLVQELEKSLEKSLGKTPTGPLQDPKHESIRLLIDFYKQNELAQKTNLNSTERLEFLRLLGNVIETASDKQANKIFGSNIVKIVKHHLPAELSQALPAKHQKQLKEYQSLNVFRMFENKKPAEKETEQSKKSMEIDPARKVHTKILH